MTGDEIRAFFPSAFNSPLHLGAVSYAVPTLAWLQGPCYDAFRARYWAENLDKWIVRWECRDFARAFACFAGECWATTQGGTTDDGLAVGEIWFIPDATKFAGHAINACFTDKGLVYIDPQTNIPWPITPAQFSSRYFVRF